MAEEEKSFEYWLSVGTVEALSPKCRIEYLDKIKKLYLETLYKLNSVENENIKLYKDIENLTVALEKERELNSELTEELSK